MKVYFIMTLPSTASFKFSHPKIRDVYLDRKAAVAEVKRLERSPYATGYYWVESKTVKDKI